VGVLLLVSGEPHEPDPRPRQHRGEDVHPGDHAPVDDQMLTRGPHRRTTGPALLLTVAALLRSDQAPEVAVRARISSRPRPRQQPLGADPSLAGLDGGRDQRADRLVVTRPRPARRAVLARLDTLDHPPHRLVRGPADFRSATVGTHQLVGGNNVHFFPLALQWNSLSGDNGDWQTPSPSPLRNSRSRTTRRAEGGDCYLATSGDLTWPPAGTFPWPRTPVMAGGGRSCEYARTRVSPLPARGDVWWCELPDIKRRPVVVISRDAAVAARRRAMVVPCSTVERGLASEVALRVGRTRSRRTPSRRPLRLRASRSRCVWSGSGGWRTPRIREICAARSVPVDC